MNFRLARLALGASLLLAGGAVASSALADPEVLVKCDGVGPGQRFINAGGWAAYPNPDHSVTITRDKGKFAIELTGDVPLSSHAVFALPMQNIEKFRVLGRDGVETFYLVTGANSGKTQLKHSIYGGKDGSHLFNIRVTTLDRCTVVSSDVVVGKEVPDARPETKR
jgi:hypothetical protein